MAKTQFKAPYTLACISDPSLIHSLPAFIRSGRRRIVSCPCPISHILPLTQCNLTVTTTTVSDSPCLPSVFARVCQPVRWVLPPSWETATARRTGDQRVCAGGSPERGGRRRHANRHGVPVSHLRTQTCGRKQEHQNNNVKLHGREMKFPLTLSYGYQTMGGLEVGLPC